MINSKDLVDKHFSKTKNEVLKKECNKSQEKFNEKLNKILIKIEKKIIKSAQKGYTGIIINNPINIYNSNNSDLHEAVISELHSAGYIVKTYLYPRTLNISWEDEVLSREEK